jgi:glycosyltransferase involved in cell wall biosynthesis
MSTVLRYVLITPARDEAQFIELAIKSVAAQKMRPIKWVIVSDGSTDGTDEIVGKYSAQYPWIELVQMPEHSERNFAGKVHAFNAGYARMKNLQYDAIASMDADISFDSEYFSFLLGKLAGDRRLGLVGTPFQDGSKETYDYRFTSIEHVSGACQLFRRACFEQIGGYVPVKAGGIDLAAVTAARMRGWKTRTFTEKVCVHHRELGRALGGGLAERFRQGVKDYVFGGHPVWELFRFGYQLARPPVVLGGLALGAGYFWAAVQRLERPIPDEMVAFRRHEQMERLKAFFLNVHRRPIVGNGLVPTAGSRSSRRPSL